MYAWWQVPGEADVCRHERAENRLALGADVEQAGAKSQTHAESGTDQWSRLSGRFGDRSIAANCPLDKRRLGAADLVP